MPTFKVVESQKTETSPSGVTSVVVTTTQHFLWKKPRVTTVIGYYEGERHLWQETVLADGLRTGYRP